MKLLSFVALSALTATQLQAEDTRQLDAHEHGVGKLDMAVEGSQIAMSFHAPGADIVGFEYAATSDADLNAIETALARLSKPLELFSISAAAGCNVVNASAELESEEHHDEHQDEAKKEDDDHDHDHSHDHEHEHEEDHGEKDDDAGHTEFHAEYLIECSSINEIKQIEFAYFATFENAVEVEVQLITDAGATSFEVERAAPTLDLSALF